MESTKAVRFENNNNEVPDNKPTAIKNEEINRAT